MKKYILLFFLSPSSWAGIDPSTWAVNGHSDNQLPYVLVVDAGVSASAQAPERQMQFVHSYAMAVREALIRGLDDKVIKDSFMDFKNACETTDDKQLRAISCGYVAGINVFKNKELKFDLEDFGYIKTSITGLVSGEYKIFNTKKGEVWLVYAPVTDKVESNKCYVMDGYLSREGQYGPRGAGFEREFIPTSINEVKLDVCKLELRN